MGIYFLVYSLLQYTNCFQWVFIWVPFVGEFSLLGPYVSIRESHGSSPCLPNVTISNYLTNFSLLNALSTHVLCIFLCLFERTFVCTYAIYCEALRLPAILSHFMHSTPFSSGNISAAEANLVSARILKACSVQFSFCWKLKWAIIGHAIQTSEASPNFPHPYEILPSWCILLKYLRSWLFCTHSCGEHLILYSLKPSMSCGSSSTHSASILRNKCVGNCNSLLLVLLWSESSCSGVVISESSVKSITSSASSWLLAWSKVLGHGSIF